MNGRSGEELMPAWHARWHGLLYRLAERHCPDSCRHGCTAFAACLQAGCLRLHGLSGEDGDRLIGRLLAGRRCFLLADYALAERNLHVPCVLFRSLLETGTGPHACRCREFLQAGGLEGVLCRPELHVLERRQAGCGLLTVARCAGNSGEGHGQGNVL